MKELSPLAQLSLAWLHSQADSSKEQPLSSSRVTLWLQTSPEAIVYWAELCPKFIPKPVRSVGGWTVLTVSEQLTSLLWNGANSAGSQNHVVEYSDGGFSTPRKSRG